MNSYQAAVNAIAMNRTVQYRRLFKLVTSCVMTETDLDRPAATDVARAYVRDVEAGRVPVGQLPSVKF